MSSLKELSTLCFLLVVVVVLVVVVIVVVVANDILRACVRSSTFVEVDPR
jgi:threonine/homoserine/homoserine lactone efflux protein